MAETTNIEWADATWNPVTGCIEVSPGCDHCYAKTFAERFRGVPGHHFENGFDLQLRPERLGHPLRWTKPKRIFVNSMSDLFHNDVPDDYIAQVFAVMARAEQHTFQLLTKRHGRMRSLLNSPDFRALVASHIEPHVDPTRGGHIPPGPWDGPGWWPLPHLWLGVSVEDQARADLRIPALLQTPAAVRFLSMEPLLGPVDLDQPRCEDHDRDDLATDDRGREWCAPCTGDGFSGELSYGHWLDPVNGGIEWAIVGGESGRGARPMHPAWARDLRDQCTSAGVPFLFKQWGAWTPIGTDDLVGLKDDFWMRPDGTGEYYGQRNQPGVQHMVRLAKKDAGRELDGRTWTEFPTAVVA